MSTATPVEELQLVVGPVGAGSVSSVPVAGARVVVRVADGVVEVGPCPVPVRLRVLGADPTTLRLEQA